MIVEIALACYANGTSEDQWDDRNSFGDRAVQWVDFDHNLETEDDSDAHFFDFLIEDEPTPVTTEPIVEELPDEALEIEDNSDEDLDEASWPDFIHNRPDLRVVAIEQMQRRAERRDRIRYEERIRRDWNPTARECRGNNGHRRGMDPDYRSVWRTGRPYVRFL